MLLYSLLKTLARKKPVFETLLVHLDDMVADIHMSQTVALVFHCLLCKAVRPYAGRNNAIDLQ